MLHHLFACQAIRFEKHSIIRWSQGSDGPQPVGLIAARMRFKNGLKCGRVATRQLFSLPALGPLYRRGGQKNLQIGMRKNNRSLVAAFGDNVAALSHATLHMLHRLPHRRRIGHRSRGGGDPFGANLCGNIAILHQHAAVCKDNPDLFDKPRQLRRILQRYPLLNGDERHCPIHRAGIDVAPAESAGQCPSRRTLTGAGGSIEGNDHVRNPISKCSH